MPMPPPTRRLDCPAYILAGGRSARFGSDKARALLRGEPLIAAQARTLDALGHDALVVAREDGQYADLGLRTIGDIEPGLGPIGGLRTALTHRRDGWLLLTSCDLLDVRAEWIETLLAKRTRRPDADAIVFRDERWQPFPGLYHTRLLAREDVWRRGSMQRLLDAANAIASPAPTTPGIRQANTPDDMPEGGGPPPNS